MKNKIFLLFIPFLLSSALICQDDILDKTNVPELNRLILDFTSRYESRHRETLRIADELGIPVKTILADGTVIELQFFRDGFPFYYITHNATSAQSISTDEVHPGGSAGLSLDGNGMVLYEWDAGKVRTTHQELTGRVTIGDPGTNTTLHDHSTHVAGTLIASGVDTGAKGMAYAATLIDYDWNNDESELSSAGAGGALVSNHSYGYGRGWHYNILGDGLWGWYGDPDISSTEDCYFGFYDSSSRDWDEIAYNAPYLLICKSAGNDRNDNGPTPGDTHWVWDWDGGGWYYSNAIRDPDGQYDCIGLRGICKNVMSVGAVNDIFGGYVQPSDVVATSFSSWGPADDGRIKPDIVANGYTLWSSISSGDTAYTLKSGTSMSAPSVAGSAILLQEHYSELNRTYMRSSTVKGLIIHTADEAGPDPGPDYMFGWGLMNTQTAAQVITDMDEYALIMEEDLINGGTYEITVTPVGTEPLIATLCWNDPPGTPVAPQLDPADKMLVNDLDMRITRPGFTAYPWKLNRLNPSGAATNNGDNDVDNVEKIEINSPDPESYTITITHKGTLSSPQTFSLIVSGIDAHPPEIEISPLELNISIAPDETSDELLRIANNGFRDLIYSCSIDYLTRPDVFDNSTDHEIPDTKPIPEPATKIGHEYYTTIDTPFRDEIEIHHDNGVLGGGLGAGGGAFFTTAARFTPEELDSYYGGYALVKVKFFITYWPFTSVVLKVWRGGGYGDAGTEIYSQDVTSSIVSDSWNEFVLPSPITLIADDEYWLGYYISTDEESYPAANDTGPSVIGKGAWLSWFGGAWQDLYESDFDWNWVIRGVLSPQWLSITANGSGTVPGSGREFVDVGVHFDATGLSSGTTKTANILVNSNDPLNPEISIPVTMNVTESQPDPPGNPVIYRSGNSIVLEWDPVPGATSYNIYSDTDPYGSFTNLEASGINSTTWSDSDISGLKKYYIVKANN